MERNLTTSWLSLSIEVDINLSRLNPYGNTIYATNAVTGGGGTTAIVIVPSLVSAQAILAVNGQFFSDKIALTIVQIDNNGLIPYISGGMFI